MGDGTDINVVIAAAAQEVPSGPTACSFWPSSVYRPTECPSQSTKKTSSAGLMKIPCVYVE